MSNALHDYAKLFERYAANNGGTGVILAGEDCLSLANEMRMDADAIDVENAKLRELLQRVLTSHNKMCTNRGTCLECLFFNAKPFEPACPIVSVTRDARELGIEATP